jgi:lipopolysaccharide biosynthesis glycosyltransferase
MLNDSIDQVLYVDADTIIQESISHLLDSCKMDCALYGVPDFSEIKLKLHHNIDRYINCGVMVMRLKVWRKNNYLSGCLDAAQTHAAKLLFSDQCAINLCLAGNIQVLDPRWNQFVQSGSNFKAGRGGILHFLTKTKPWQRWFDHPLGELYWHYRRVSPWADGDAQEPKMLSEYSQFARKLNKEGKHAQAQSLYENIIGNLKKRIG